MKNKMSKSDVKATLAIIGKYSDARSAFCDAQTKLRESLAKLEHLDDTELHPAIVHHRNNSI